MTVLSLTAVSRLAEHCIRQAGEPLAVDEVVVLLNLFGVEPDRARAGIRLGEIVGRLEVDLEDRVRVRALRELKAAAA